MNLSLFAVICISLTPAVDPPAKTTLKSVPAAELGRPAAIVLTPQRMADLREIAFQAARDGDAKTLQEYFSIGRPVNEPNARGDTLLTVAAYSRQLPAVEVILKQPKLAIDARNRMGLTALTAAAFKGDVEIAKALIKAGADVNAKNGSGQNALMFAALAGRTKMVEYLIAVRADVKAADKAGNTPLRLARGQGATEAAERLQSAAVQQPAAPMPKSSSKKE